MGNLPRPLPPHLWPQNGPLGSDDMMLVLTVGELMAALTTLVKAHPKTLDHNVRLVHRDGSPWVEIDVVVSSDPEDARVRRFAIWRYTRAVYEVGPDGAVADDPFFDPTVGER